MPMPTHDFSKLIYATLGQLLLELKRKIVVPVPSNKAPKAVQCSAVQNKAATTAAHA